LEFGLYDAPTGGAELWGEELLTEFTNGYYSVVLGANPSNPIDSAVFDVPAVYLGLRVDGAELLPRQRVVSTPYAVRSAVAEVAPWAGLTDVPPGFADGIDDDALGGLSCADGELAKWSATGATWECGGDDDTRYDGTHFAVSNQACPPGQVVTGVNAAGSVTCVPAVQRSSSCPANQFMTGIDAEGRPICGGLPVAVLRDYVNTNCYLYFGWRDSCDGCTAEPFKAGRVRGAFSGCSSTGADSGCAVHALFGQSVELFGLNTDGNVGNDDKFWVGLKCQ
jgi:hypothetical protein